MRILLLTVLLAWAPSLNVDAQNGGVLIPMDSSQGNHLRAYGVTFRHLADGGTAEWLLHYRGGSFLLPNTPGLIEEARRLQIDIEQIPESELLRLRTRLDQPDHRASRIPLNEAPRIAVYAPPGAMPWNDAVRLALDYADVPYDQIYDQEVLDGSLNSYDWVHLHHEDFTGQHGKFWSLYSQRPWYVESVRQQNHLAQELGYASVASLKRDVARTIRSYVVQGGYLFAMCSGPNTLDIALAAGDLDIVAEPFDGDPPANQIQENLDFSQTFAFENFQIDTDPFEYRHGTIDIDPDLDQRTEELDYFTLFDFAPRWDPIPAMLTQNHVSSIRGFFGQTTAFRRHVIKSSVTILGEASGRREVKYLHGRLGEGTFTFYAGHDPEDYTHRVNDPPTDLSLHPNSPGYRLILNNILFPAAEPPRQKT
ncbi:MAG: asparagine synthetase B [Balneolaceae bacterium]